MVEVRDALVVLVDERLTSMKCPRRDCQCNMLRLGTVDECTLTEDCGVTPAMTDAEKVAAKRRADDIHRIRHLRGR